MNQRAHWQHATRKKNWLEQDGKQAPKISFSSPENNFRQAIQISRSCDLKNSHYWLARNVEDFARSILYETLRSGFKSVRSPIDMNDLLQDFRSLCYAIPCHPMVRQVMPCHPMVCQVMPCHAMPCHAMPCHTMQAMSCICCAVLCCAVLCCAVLCCAVLCCAVLCCAVLCCAVLCCAVLCCAVLCCAVLCCAVLCCAVLCCVFLR